MSARQLLQAFDRWRAAGVPLVLVTVVGTEGSTYTKPGHRMLIAAGGEFQELVSGGCLEGDLAEHAREVVATGRAELITYDLRGESDELWGLGIGCNGLFRILLQPLASADRYEPFASIAACLAGDAACTTATVISSDDPGLPAGATIVGERATGLPPAWRARLAEGCRNRSRAASADVATETIDGRSARVLYAPLRPMPRLLVVGAGLDAVPLVDIAARIGWRVTVVDHRPANLARGDLGAADGTLCLSARDAARSLPLARYAAAVVMNHHLDTDRAWLAELARSGVGYVGLLGPPARRERLLGDLGPAAALALGDRLHAPVGLAIRADSPESIALAILAEVHAAIAGRVDLVAAGRRA